MRKLLAVLPVIAILLFCAGICETPADFALSGSIRVIEEGAFEGTALGAGIYIPPETRSVSSSAFDDSVERVYGYLGTAAERYAQQADKTFIPLDITNLNVTADCVWIPQGSSVTLRASADSIAPCEYAFTVAVGGTVFESGYSASAARVFTLTEWGEATVTVKAKSIYDETETVKTGVVHVEKGIPFVSAPLYVEKGDTVSLLAEEETRPLTLTCSSAYARLDGTDITGLSVGTCTVKGEIVLPEGIVTGTLSVTVCYPITAVTISGLPKGLYEGESAKGKVTYSPANARFNGFVWTSSDESVLTVDESGRITALSPGTASVTATAHSGKSAMVAVEVWAPVSEIIPPEGFTADTEVLTVIPCTVLPGNAHDTNLTYTSSDTSVAVISAGKIKGLKPGEVIVTAKAHNGVTVSFPVTILRPVTSVRLSASKANLDLFGTLELVSTVYPADASDPALTWTSSDDAVASVNENGVVYGSGTGTAVIRAESGNGKYAECTVTVFETLPAGIDFERLYVTMKAGESRAASVLFTPDKVQDRSLFYESSDPTVVTVDADGVLYALREGTVTVTAVSGAVQNVVNTCKVSVIGENDLPLAGLVIGLNPGHQIKANLTQLPVFPGSSTKKNAVGVGGKGNYTGVPEYETNLAVGLKLCDMLRSQGATVVMTRTSNDVMLTNIERANMLNAAGVDISIQIHCDDGGASTTSGVATYYRTGQYTGDDWVAESRRFAELTSQHISDVTGTNNRGVVMCNTYMSLNYCTTPAILVEMGYMSSRTEDYLLADDAYRTKLAQGMLDAIADYFDRKL